MLKVILNRLNTQDEEIISEKKNRLGSDQEESPQNRSSTLESCVKSTSNISRIWTIGGRNITNLWFADDIDALTEEEQELEDLIQGFDKTCTSYKMEISAKKTKLTTNSAKGIQREIKVKEQNLVTLTSFKYLGAIVSEDGSKPEIPSRIAQVTATLT